MQRTVENASCQLVGTAELMQFWAVLNSPAHRVQIRHLELGLHASCLAVATQSLTRLKSRLSEV